MIQSKRTDPISAAISTSDQRTAPVLAGTETQRESQEKSGWWVAHDQRTVPHVARRMLDAQDFYAVVWVRVVRELLAGGPVGNEVPVCRAVAGHGEGYDAGPEGKHAGGCQDAQGSSHRGHHECQNALRTMAVKGASRMDNSFFQITKLSPGKYTREGLQPTMADATTARTLSSKPNSVQQEVSNGSNHSHSCWYQARITLPRRPAST